MKFHFPLFAVLVTLVLAACSTTAAQSPQETTKPQSAQPPVPAGAKADATVGAAIDPNKYVIGSEDVLFIKTWREPDFTFNAAVRPDGKITGPLVGEVQASGLTPAQLTKSLTELFGKIINNPQVDIFVIEVRSKKFYIVGEVGKPGSYPLVGPITVLDALSNAGGFREFASKNKIKILRGSTTYKFNYDQVTSGKHMEQNINIENGDHIIVK